MGGLGCGCPSPIPLYRVACCIVKVLLNCCCIWLHHKIIYTCRDVYWLDMMNQDLEDENYELLEMVMDAQQEEKAEQKTTDAQQEVKDAEQKVEKAEQKVKVVDDPSDFIECVQSTAVYIDQPTNKLDAKRLTY